MKDTSLLIRTAMTALVATGLTAGSVVALADNHDREQCAGVIKAGKNDCATSTNACHGHVAVDSSPEAWIYVPKGTCERIVGARVVQVKDPTPADKR